MLFKVEHLICVILANVRNLLSKNSSPSERSVPIPPSIRTVLVSGMDLSKEIVEQYLENPEIGGGKIEQIVFDIADKSARVTFEDSIGETIS